MRETKKEKERGQWPDIWEQILWNHEPFSFWHFSFSRSFSLFLDFLAFSRSFTINSSISYYFSFYISLCPYFDALTQCLKECFRFSSVGLLVLRFFRACVRACIEEQHRVHIVLQREHLPLKADTLSVLLILHLLMNYWHFQATYIVALKLTF